MNADVTWLPNWYCTRLHAVVGPPSNGSVSAVCSAQVYFTLPKPFALRRLAKGNTPRCKKCEAFFGLRPEKTLVAKCVGFDAESSTVTLHLDALPTVAIGDTWEVKTKSSKEGGAN